MSVFDNKTITGVKLYNPKIEVWYEGRKVIVQTIKITKSKSPITYIKIGGIITEKE